LPLETASFITDLVAANPAHTDGLSQADSQMRLIKSTIKATFPNFTSAALTSTQAQLDAAGSQASGTASSVIPLGTALLPGLTPVGDPNTGLWSPAADQLAFSLGGTQVLLMGGSALVTSLGIAASAVASSGAYSGGSGQLVPIGAVLEWYDDTLPAEGGYAWANGQIIANANTVCPILLARWGNKFGGNGTTTMGVPDRREAVGIGKRDMGSTTARGLISHLSVLGLNTVIGEGVHTLTASEGPLHSHPNTLTDPGHTHTQAGRQVTVGNSGSPVASIQYNNGNVPSEVPITSSTTGISINNATNSAGGAAHNNVQPSVVVNYILRLA
jgi:microcystin-dependent protein